MVRRNPLTGLMPAAKYPRFAPLVGGREMLGAVEHFG
jgi:hypothetical protein